MRTEHVRCSAHLHAACVSSVPRMSPASTIVRAVSCLDAHDGRYLGPREQRVSPLPGVTHERPQSTLKNRYPVRMVQSPRAPRSRSRVVMWAASGIRAVALRSGAVRRGQGAVWCLVFLTLSDGSNLSFVGHMGVPLLRPRPRQAPHRVKKRRQWSMRLRHSPLVIKDSSQ